MFLGINLKYLRKLRGLKQDEMQAHTGITRATWSNYELSISQPDLETLSKISKFFGVSIDTLITEDISKNVHLIKKDAQHDKGQNVHLNVHPSVHLNAQNEPNSAENLVQIPITDISVAAGTGQYNSSHVENVDIIRLPVHFLKRNHSYLCVRIKGPSMAPTLQDGGYVIIRLLDRAEWAKMPDERVFVISDLEGKAYLKRVKNRFKQGFILLKSDSLDQANHPSFNLHASEINTIWEVEWYFTAKMPNIHDQYYSRLQQLEDRVDDLSSHLLKIEPKLK